MARRYVFWRRASVQGARPGVAYRWRAAVQRGCRARGFARTLGQTRDERAGLLLQGARLRLRRGARGRRRARARSAAYQAAHGGRLAPGGHRRGSDVVRARSPRGAAGGRSPARALSRRWPARIPRAEARPRGYQPRLLPLHQGLHARFGRPLAGRGRARVARGRRSRATLPLSGHHGRARSARAERLSQGAGPLAQAVGPRADAGRLRPSAARGLRGRTTRGNLPLPFRPERESLPEWHVSPSKTAWIMKTTALRLSCSPRAALAN